MNDKLAALWDRAEKNPGEAVDIGRLVVCDVCNEDYTDSAASGGFIFTSNGYCPSCAPKALPMIINYGEERYIRARCPEGQSFADFVRAYRGTNNTILFTETK